MNNVNCIIILNRDKDQILFCKRRKNPYLGLYNFVGGKIEAGEESLAAAYRELEEETGISPEDTTLVSFMDFCWHLQKIHMEVYVGVLSREVILREEKHPLSWLGLEHNFFDMNTFAGEGNIGHMIEVLKQSGYINS